MLEFQLKPDSISTIHIWLIVLLGISLLLTIFYLLHLGRFRIVVNAQYLRFSKLFLAVLASLQVFAWQLYFYSDSHDTVALWCFPLALIVGTGVWKLAKRSLDVNPLPARTIPIVIILISVVEVVGFAQATRQFCTEVSKVINPASDLMSLGLLVENSTTCASTDCGKPIKLYERQVTTNAFREFIERNRAAFETMSERAMLRAQPFVQSNCHGWVFTEGKHILKGQDVQLILNDNNYIEVEDPQSHDVAVYRNHDGEIVHTGLVRGSLAGATMVESKWGIGGVYMHIAEEQPYSQEIKYYRTCRPSHDVLMAQRNPVSSTDSTLLANQAVDDGVK